MSLTPSSSPTGGAAEEAPGGGGRVVHWCEPVAGLRQVLVFPADRGAVRRPGLFRYRLVWLQTADGRVYAFRFARSWLAAEADLVHLAGLLREDGGRSNGDDLAAWLGWALETTLAIQSLNLVQPEPDAAAVRAVAVESCLGTPSGDHARVADTRAAVRRLEEELARELGEALSRFTAGLDAGILALAPLWPEGLTPARYNWLLGRGAKSRQWRLQAARVFPALIPLLTGERGGVQETEAALLQVIDRGRPLLDAVAERYGVRKAIARHALTLPDGLLDGGRIRLGVLLRGLSPLPPERYPHTEAEWRVYLHILYEVLPSLTGRPPGSVLNARFLSAIARRGWEATERRLQRFGLGGEGAGLLRPFVSACQGLVAWELSLSTHLSPTEVAELAARTVDAALVEVGVVEIARLARRWPTVQGESRLAHAAWAERVQGMVWPAVIEAPFEWEDCRILPLTRPEDLVEEGKVMDHCVATYVQACMDGRSFILSVRDPSGARLATGEIRFQRDRLPGRYRVVPRQLMAQGDTPASDAAARAFAGFCRYLESAEARDRVAQVVAELDQARRWRRKGGEHSLLKRIEHEIGRDALARLGEPRLRLEPLVQAALGELGRQQPGEAAMTSPEPNAKDSAP